MFNLNDYQNKVLSIICTCLDNDAISLDSNIFEIGINSITFVKVMLTIEDEFNLEFDEEMLDYSRFNSIGDVVAYVTQCIGETHAN